MMVTHDVAQAGSALSAASEAAHQGTASRREGPSFGPLSQPATQAAQQGNRGARLDAASVANAVASLNEQAQHGQKALHFAVDDATGQTVITVTDTETDQVIRQIPPEELLAVMRNLAEGFGDADQHGLLVHETA